MDEEEECDTSYPTTNTSMRLPEPTILTEPEKSVSDSKTYKVIRLPNQLTALLASNFPAGVQSVDPAHKNCGQMKNVLRRNMFAVCALSVKVGFFSDPPDIPGLAHLLEHMVYIGCDDEYRRYKKFRVFVSQYNAGTWCESTTYYFRCPVEDLHRALNIFTQFLVSPTLPVEFVKGERDIVHSEFNLKSPSDYNRIDQLISLFMTESNPARKFKWGDSRTLKKNLTDERLQDSLRAFHRRYYSANLMTLVIFAGAIPIQTMESCVAEIFTRVPNRGAQADHWQTLNPLFKEREFHSIYFVGSVSDVNDVILMWRFPPFGEQLYHSKANTLIDFLLNHRGEGGLFHYLKRKLWALSLSAKIEPETKFGNSLYSLYLLQIKLSENGFRNLFAVIEATFAYLKLVNELLSNSLTFSGTFKQVKKLMDLGFEYREENTITMQCARDLARNMHHFPSSLYLKGPKSFLLGQPKHAEVQELLLHLNPENVNIMLLAKKFDHIINIEEQIRKIELSKTEEWFQTRFDVEAIPQKMVAQWRNAYSSEFRSPSLDNPFIPSSFQVLDGPTDKLPVLVKQVDVLEIWHKLDTRSNQPVASILTHFLLPHGLESIESQIMLDLFVFLLRYQLTEEIHLGAEANLKCTIMSSVWGGLIIQMHGFSDKLPSLFHAMITGMKNSVAKFNSKIFNTIKMQVKKYYYNVLLDPTVLTLHLLSYTIEEPYHTMTDQYNHISQVHETKFLTFLRTCLASFNVQCLAQGNISRETALNECSKLLEAFVGVQPVSKPSRHIRRLDVGERCVAMESYNKIDRNNAVTLNYYQWGEADASQYFCLRSLVHKMNGRAFDTLRTKEQLGYSVHCTFHDDLGIIGFTVNVHSSKAELKTWKVEERIDAFLEDLEKDLLSHVDEQEEESVDDDEDDLEVEDIEYNQMEANASRNFDQIINAKSKFRDHHTPDMVSGKDMGLMLQKMIRGESRRKLSVQVVQSELEDSAVPNLLPMQLKDVGKGGLRSKKYYVMNLDEFKTNLDLYGWPNSFLAS